MFPQNFVTSFNLNASSTQLFLLNHWRWKPIRISHPIRRSPKVTRPSPKTIMQNVWMLDVSFLLEFCHSAGEALNSITSRIDRGRIQCWPVLAKQWMTAAMCNKQKNVINKLLMSQQNCCCWCRQCCCCCCCCCCKIKSLKWSMQCWQPQQQQQPELAVGSIKLHQKFLKQCNSMLATKNAHF